MLVFKRFVLPVECTTLVLAATTTMSSFLFCYSQLLLLGNLVVVLVSSSPLPSNDFSSPFPLSSSSPWDQIQFNQQSFNFVQGVGEEISDEEWIDMMTRDLQRHKVLGQIIDQVPPYVINIDYSQSHCVHLGNTLQARDTQQEPLTISFPTNKSSLNLQEQSGSSGLFTLLAIDPDVPNLDSQFLHWLVVNIPDEDIQRGDVLAEYVGPLPSSSSSNEHRFIFLAYRQSHGVIDVERVGLPHAESCDWSARSRFNASRFSQLYQLDRPVAVNYFMTQYDSSVAQTIDKCQLIQRQKQRQRQRPSSP